MKPALISVSIIAFFFSFFTRTDKINHLIMKAESAYSSRNYETAAFMYDTLLHIYELNTPEIQWNLASSWLKAFHYDSAHKYFEQLSISGHRKIRSESMNQLGLIAYYFKDDRAGAILQFKKALRINPDNQEAIYNLELLRKTSLETFSSDQNSSQDRDSIKTHIEKKQATRRKKESYRTRSEERDRSVKSNHGETPGKSPRKDHESANDKSDAENNASDNDSSGKLITRRKSNQDISSERILELTRQNEIRYLQQIKRKPETAKKTGPPY